MADTLLLMMFSWASKRGNICCGRKMFLKEIKNIFVSRTQILCPQQMLPARANRETFVSATMCLQHCVLVRLIPFLPSARTTLRRILAPKVWTARIEVSTSSTVRINLLQSTKVVLRKYKHNREVRITKAKGQYSSRSTMSKLG